ncbi:MAG: 30S ribosomal protein S12 methylthiotransferase RimO [Ignavibacteriae bacterium]|nr:MAG: 30S ribosomal protein S12 methylthiotransferase RimO [Ignavibacteriota bacterium]
MKTKTLKKNKVNVITLGCSKNIYDSEILMGQLKANNFNVEHESDKNDASVVIINTCGFIENAKQESINTILEYVNAKEKGLVDKVYVTGCLSERYKPELSKEIPDVDDYFGTHDLPRLLKTLNADYKHELIGERVLTTPHHFAYFKISEGCDRPCSFCAIPIMRGKHVSIPMEQLVQHAKLLAKNGTKELILIAQDLTYYGLDVYGKRNLSKLLLKLSGVDGIEWIRLHYAFPTGFPEDVLDVMKETDKICNYLDMPLQHISDRILKSMLRGTTKKKTNDLIKMIKDKVPGIALRTTLITGYPGETNDEFLELKDWVKEMKFERLGVFTYSHEENTRAFNMKDDIPDKLKKKRAEEIMKVQNKISLEHNKKLIGRTLKVLFDRKEGKHFIGRTEFDSPEVDNEVLIDAKKNYARIGDFAEVKINGALEYDLTGEIAST